MRLLVTIGLSAVVSSAACGGRVDEAPTPADAGSDGRVAAPPPTLETICNLLPAALCAPRAECCGALSGYDERRCVAFERARCEVRVQAVTAGKLKFDASGYDACVDAFAQGARRCTIVAGPSPELLEERKRCRFFNGDLSAGADCSIDEECAYPSRSPASAGCVEGTCGTWTVVGVGEPCNATSFLADCGMGAYCDGHCKARLVDGEVCTESRHCIGLCVHGRCEGAPAPFSSEECGAP